ncbi:hypothetical protein N8Z24_00155 [bacterium]|nr:hypothetical protein [bacterium]
MAKKTKTTKFKHKLNERFSVPFVIREVSLNAGPENGRYWVAADTYSDEVNEAFDWLWLTEKEADSLTKLPLRFKDNEMFFVKIHENSRWLPGVYSEQDQGFLVLDEVVLFKDLFELGERITAPRGN